MLLTLTTTTRPARDLGFLLRKHPDRVQTFPLSVGVGHVFYPEASDERCTAALLLDLDPVTLVRGRENSRDGGVVESYVNDRPYAVSSFMSVAIARIFTQALGGRSDRPELAEREFALEATFEPVRATADLPARLFEPLGYAVTSTAVAESHDVDGQTFRRVTLRATTKLANLLAHLYVLVPVMDEQKHYWVGEDEVEKLFRFGSAWLASHPEREYITRRYLDRAPSLARAAVARLDALDVEEKRADQLIARGEAELERPLRLQDRRIAAVAAVVAGAGATSVVDLGCGDGDLLVALAREPKIARIVGTDVSSRELDRARERLERVPMPASKREDVRVFQSSLMYFDRRLTGFDAATLTEVIEHVDRERLPMLERIVFGELRPPLIVVTTPNRDYNVKFPGLRAGAMRHPDHRFELSRVEFAQWSSDVAAKYGYAVEAAPIGDVDSELGAPTQMAVFRCA